eukprot:scaffold27929_cov176-Amphora_coffeaeformis.AAC.3
MNISLLGAPGSGKSVYDAKSISARFVVASDVLRQSKLIDDEAAATGNLIDNGLVSEALLENLTVKLNDSRIVLDGFPRTMEQVHIMEATLPLASRVNRDVSLEVTNFFL